MFILVVLLLTNDLLVSWWLLSVRGVSSNLPVMKLNFESDTLINFKDSCLVIYLLKLGCIVTLEVKVSSIFSVC